MSRSSAGYTLIEAMIAVAIIGILAAIAYSGYGLLAEPGRPGHLALRIEDACELLVRVEQEAQQLSAIALAAESEHAPRPLPGATPGFVVTREVHPEATPGLFRVTLRASWTERRQPMERIVVTLVGGRP